MDAFGIGAGIVGAARVYFQSGRCTGRTVALVESLKTGDRVIFSCAKEAQRVRRLCKERGVDIETMVVRPDTPDRLFHRGSIVGDGRALFDHSWVEQYYMDALERARQDIDHFQNAMSGHGEPHRKTRRKAEEIAKWSQYGPFEGD